MNNIWQNKRFSSKTYLTIISLILTIVILVLNFVVFPKTIKFLAGITSIQIEVIKKQLFNITIGYLIFISLFNFYFWKIEKKLENEEKKVQSLSMLNPNDSAIQEKMRQIEKKRKFYTNLLEPVFMIVLGLTIGLIAYKILMPLYRLSSF